MNECPYCRVKAHANVPRTYKAKADDGKCSKCGAYIDIGQQSVKIKGYKQMYDGVVGLIDDIVTTFNKYLDVFDVDVEDFQEDFTTKISVLPSDIIRALFVGYSGSTTVGNFGNAIGIDDVYEPIEYELKREEQY